MRGGVMYYSADVYDALGVKPFAAKPAVTVEKP